MNKKMLLLPIALIATSLAGCTTNSGDTSNGENEQIDASRTQIFVNNFGGGYGGEWLAKVKARFEAKHAEESYEEGKKGVQVYINNLKSIADVKVDTILDNRDEVYFTEQSYYYDLKTKGILGDITDIVTPKLAEYGESRSIEDKLSDEQKAYLGIQENGETHYYGIPHYNGFFGLTYNVDLFDEKGFYFAATPLSARLDDQFISGKNSKKSAGPDGAMGTSDDGLPVTFEEFFNLCEYIVKKGCQPMVFAGKQPDYANNLINAIATNIEGKEQMQKVFTMEGEATDLGKIVNGEFVKDSDPTTLNSSIGYETSRMGGKYYGIKFMETVLNNEKYRNSTVTNSGYSHIDAQTDFLYSGYDGTSSIAMLSDGVWWENEAKDIFQALVDEKGPSFARTSRKFAVMPLPVPNSEYASSHKKNVFYDHLFSFSFMKANVAEWKKPLVKDFLQFCNTDESLIEYTVTTNTPKALDYTVPETERAKMSYFGRNLLELKDNSDIVYPYSSNSLYISNQSFFHTDKQYQTNVNGTNNQFVVNLLKEGVSAENYFNGMYSFYKTSWATLNK